MKLHFADSCLVSTGKLKQLERRASGYIAHLQEVSETQTYAYPESSINLPTDNRLLKTVLNAKKALVTKKLKYIVVVGIGGSNLGTKAVYDALTGSIDHLRPEKTPKLLFLDTCDTEILRALLDFLKKNVSDNEEILINIISKSGGTTETMMNADILRTGLKHIKDLDSRIVLTTDVDSALWKMGEEHRYTLLPIPDVVGGRYSVFSAVGLFPLAAAGFNIQAFRSGAREMRERCLESSVEKNPALASASVVYAQVKAGKAIHDTFVFHPQLESLGKWYRQLLGESIGKEKNTKGETIHAGVTPTVSVGSTDLHSVGQLYLGGPRNVVTTFVGSESLPKPLNSSQHFLKLLPSLKAGTAPQDIMSAILEGTERAYRKQHIPFMHISLEDLSEQSIGAFLQFNMCEVMMLGHLFGVNAFDQPHVELYKKETKRLLEI